MIPLHQLLSRIRWDPEFGRGRFTLGYEDHVEDKLVLVDLAGLTIDPDNHFLLDVAGQDGEMRSIPFHRVKQVFKDGALIWERTH
jgi:uncharacterized protein (UPF0248 family)